MAGNVIPNADQALLEAQAAEGPEGVNHYDEAKQRLRAAQQQSMMTAEQAAQNRGGPAGAMTSVMNPAQEMTNDRIAALESAQARAAQATAARTSRIGAYSDAVQGARSLIADQAYLTAAPIRAQADFEINRMRQAGLNDVNSIERQMALDKATFEAEARARAQEAALEEERYQRSLAGRGGGGGGGGGGASISGGELASLLQNSGIGKLQGAAQELVQQQPAYQAYQEQLITARRTQRELEEWESLGGKPPPRPKDWAPSARVTADSADRQQRARIREQQEWDRKWAPNQQGDPLRPGVVNDPGVIHSQAQRDLIAQEQKVREQAFQQAMSQFSGPNQFVESTVSKPAERQSLLAFALAQEGMADSQYNPIYDVLSANEANGQGIFNVRDINPQLGLEMGRGPIDPSQYIGQNAYDPNMISQNQLANWEGKQVAPDGLQQAFAEALGMAVQDEVAGGEFALDRGNLSKALSDSAGLTGIDALGGDYEAEVKGVYDRQQNALSSYNEWNDTAQTEAEAAAEGRFEEARDRQMIEIQMLEEEGEWEAAAQMRRDMAIAYNDPSFLDPQSQSEARTEANAADADRAEGIEENARAEWQNIAPTIDPIDNTIKSYDDAIQVLNKQVDYQKDGAVYATVGEVLEGALQTAFDKEGLRESDARGILAEYGLTSRPNGEAPLESWQKLGFKWAWDALLQEYGDDWGS